MSKYKYTVVLPDGKEATRTSPRTYSHAIAVKDDRGWGLLGYAGNLDLANKAFNRAGKILARHRLMATGNSGVRYGWTEIRMIAVQVREIGKKTAPKPAKAKHNHAGKIRLTRELDAFGLSIPGTCHAPTELCKAIMDNPRKYVDGMIPVGTRGNWISQDPIEHEGEKYWLKIWAPDDDHLVSEASIFDRDWSKTDPWYL